MSTRLGSRRAENTSYLSRLNPDVMNLLSDIVYSCNAEYKVKRSRHDIVALEITSDSQETSKIDIYIEINVLAKSKANLKEFVEGVIRNEEFVLVKIGPNCKLKYSSDYPNIITVADWSMSADLKLCQKLLDALMKIHTLASGLLNQEKERRMT